jgi:uncharacterized protein YjbI with pentapeptide repeats
MRCKNLTPFLFGPKVCSRNPPQPEISLVVRAAYRLRPGEPLTILEEMDQGKLSAESYDEDDDERAGEVILPGDFADFKPHADVLLKGSCHVPGGEAVPTCRVTFGVGRWSKQAMVYGDRTWKKGLVADSTSDPEPFTVMPITYANSFGGEGYAANPVGKGYGDNLEVPNIQDPAKPIRSRRDRPAPACFGPVNPSWDSRAKKRGRKYGKSWKKERSPYYSEDFDWSYFNEAPADQQLEGYLAGTEEIRFTNLHPVASELSVRLPGTRVRAFLKDREGRFREIQMNLDTLFADPDDELLTLTWRGLTDVREHDMTDVTVVLIASEEEDEESRPVEHYREILDAFEKDPLGLDDLPEDIKEQKALLDSLDPTKLAEGSSDEVLNKVTVSLEKILALGGGEAGGIRHALGVAAAKAKEAKVDLGAVIADALKAPGTAPPGPGAMPRVALGDSMASVARAADAARAAMKKAGADPAALGPLDELLNDPRLKQLDPGYRPPGEEQAEAEPPGPGADLTGQDLSGRDLSGADLSGANLKATDLTRADLSGANLSGASLEATVLYEANLCNADLSETTIKSANLSLTQAKQARFDRANAEESLFENIDLTEASLEGFGATACFFTEADLTRATALKASFTRSDFTEARLEEADLTGATLEQCFCDETAMSGVVLREASLDETSFRQSDLRRANLEGAKGGATNWQEARLDDAHFDGASLPQAQFVEVSAKKTTFAAASLREARFYRALLERADLSRADLLGADLSRATVRETRFSEASLYDAKFFKSTLEKCDFKGANLKRALLDEE